MVLVVFSPYFGALLFNSLFGFFDFPFCGPILFLFFLDLNVLALSLLFGLIHYLMTLVSLMSSDFSFLIAEVSVKICSW